MARATQDFKQQGTGEMAGSASAAQFPTQKCKTVIIKAKGDNATRVCIGFSNAVTVPGETTDTTSGYPLLAGEELRLFVGNLNQIWYICDASGDALSYLWQY